MTKVHSNLKWLILILFLFVMGCTPDLEKETWIFPCNYRGTLTVYFRDKLHKGNSRIYLFNKKGISYSDFKINEGFTPDFDQSLSLIMDCNHTQKKIHYYQDSLKAKKGEVYATYFLSGSEELPCESLLITVKQ